MSREPPGADLCEILIPEALLRAAAAATARKEAVMERLEHKLAAGARAATADATDPLVRLIDADKRKGSS